MILSSLKRCIADCIWCIVTRVTSHRIYYCSHAKLKIDIADEILQLARLGQRAGYVEIMYFSWRIFLAKILYLKPEFSILVGFSEVLKWENFKFNATVPHRPQ